MDNRYALLIIVASAIVIAALCFLIARSRKMGAPSPAGKQLDATLASAVAEVFPHAKASAAPDAVLDDVKSASAFARHLQQSYLAAGVLPKDDHMAVSCHVENGIPGDTRYFEHFNFRSAHAVENQANGFSSTVYTGHATVVRLNAPCDVSGYVRVCALGPAGRLKNVGTRTVSSVEEPAKPRKHLQFSPKPLSATQPYYEQILQPQGREDNATAPKPFVPALVTNTGIAVDMGDLAFGKRFRVFASSPMAAHQLLSAEVRRNLMALQDEYGSFNLCLHGGFADFVLDGEDRFFDRSLLANEDAESTAKELGKCARNLKHAIGDLAGSLAALAA